MRLLVNSVALLSLVSVITCTVFPLSALSSIQNENFVNSWRQQQKRNPNQIFNPNLPTNPVTNPIPNPIQSISLQRIRNHILPKYRVVLHVSSKIPPRPIYQVKTPITQQILQQDLFGMPSFPTVKDSGTRSEVASSASVSTTTARPTSTTTTFSPLLHEPVNSIGPSNKPVKRGPINLESLIPSEAPNLIRTTPQQMIVTETLPSLPKAYPSENPNSSGFEIGSSTTTTTQVPILASSSTELIYVKAADSTSAPIQATSHALPITTIVPTFSTTDLVTTSTTPLTETSGVNLSMDKFNFLENMEPE